MFIWNSMVRRNQTTFSKIIYRIFIKKSIIQLVDLFSSEGKYTITKSKNKKKKFNHSAHYLLVFLFDYDWSNLKKERKKILTSIEKRNKKVLIFFFFFLPFSREMAHILVKIQLDILVIRTTGENSNLNIDKRLKKEKIATLSWLVVRD